MGQSFWNPGIATKDMTSTGLLSSGSVSAQLYGWDRVVHLLVLLQLRQEM